MDIRVYWRRFRCVKDPIRTTNRIHYHPRKVVFEFGMTYAGLAVRAVTVGGKASALLAASLADKESHSADLVALAPSGVLSTF
jgi:hypothetical protein